MTEKIVMTSSNEATSAIFGAFDANVRMIERAFEVRISNRNPDSDHGDGIVVTGERENVDMAVRTLEYLKHMSGADETVSEQSVEYVIGLVRDNSDELPQNLTEGVFSLTQEEQAEYKQIFDNLLAFFSNDERDPLRGQWCTDALSAFLLKINFNHTAEEKLLLSRSATEYKKRRRFLRLLFCKQKRSYQGYDLNF